MNRILLAILALLFLSVPSLARAKVQGVASQGGQVVVTAGISSSTKVVKTFPGCTINVYFTGTTTPVSIYSDNSGTPKANPFTSSVTDASYSFYVDDGRYDIRFSGTGISSPFTLSDILVLETGGGGGSGVTSYNGRIGAVVPIANDTRYTDLNFTGSNFSSIETRSASDLSSGTLPDARFPAVLPAISGANLTNLNASNLASGTIPDARFPATLPALNGSLLTNLNASALTTGTVADARLSSNVPLKNAINTFTANNYFTSGSLIGIGTITPRRPLDILNVAQPQLRLTYVDNTTYSDLQVNSSGTLIITPTGSIHFDAVSNQINPVNNYDQNLGQIDKKYLSLHAAELVVETLVSQNTLATIGGRVLVAPSTPLIADLAPASTTIDVKYNNLANGDRVYMESNGNVEFMAITSTPTTITGGFRYSVTRNLDGTGANQWYAGDALVNTGQTGNGFIDLYSTRGVSSATEVGPTIVGNVRASATFNDWTENWAIGNLQGLYGYGVTTYGVALGPYQAGTAHITIDATNGFRIFDGLSTVRAQIAADGSGFLGNSTFIWDGSGNINMAGWTVNANSITRNDVKIAAGDNATLTAGVAEGWFGKSATGYFGLIIKGTTAATLSIIAGDPAIGSAGRPYIAISDGTRVRIAMGELNTTAWGGSATNSMGMKIMDSSGNILAQFHDVTNSIAGWNITSTRFSAGSGTTTVGLDTTSTGGDDIRLFAGDSTPSAAPFRLTETGALTATNANITGAITANSGSLGSLSVTGTLSMSGASSVITIGTTPPTGCATGTGIFIDRSAICSVLANTTSAKIDQLGFTVVLNGTNVGSIRYQHTSTENIMQLQADRNSGAAGSKGQLLVQGNSGDSDATVQVWTQEFGGATDSHFHQYSTPSTAYATLYGTNFTGLKIGADSAPTTSTILELSSTTGAFLPPRMTTTQRDALTATNGMVIYNSSTDKLQVRAAGAWVDLH